MKQLRQQAAGLAAKRFFVPAAKLLRAVAEELQQVGEYVEAVDRETQRELRDDRERFLERLVEELCTHAFLKAPASTAQLVSQALADFPALPAFPNEFANEQKRQLIVAPEGNLVMIPTEFNYSPETNVQAYLLSLVQAAHCLDCLPEFCSAVEQRLASELFQIADGDLQAAHRRFHRDRTARDTHGPQDGGLLMVVPPHMLSHNDVLEIQTFAPFLQSFIDTLLVKFVVVIGTFQTLTRQPPDAAAAPPLEHLLAEAVASVRLEVRNVLGTFLKGSDGARLVAGSLGEAAASRDQTLFRVHLLDEEAQETLGGTGALLSQREKAAARKFAKMLIVDPFSSAKEEFGHRPVVKASLQYLPLLYPSFAFFNRCVAPPEAGAPAAPDVDFVDRYLADDFIPFLDGYVNQELTLAFSSVDCLVAERVGPAASAAQGKAAHQIPRAFKTFCRLFRLLLELAHRIPTHLPSFEAILRTLSGIFLDRTLGLCSRTPRLRGRLTVC